MSKQIAIVGGGFLGVQLARVLQHKADVTLIEQNSHFVHAPAMIRALVQPELLQRALIPYDHLLDRGQVLRARAVGLDTQGVTLEDGRQVSAHYIVMATGSGNGVAFKPGDGGIEGLRSTQARIHAQLAASHRIVIVGAGVVGIELAGEMSHYMPGKRITLVSGDPALLPTWPPSLGAKLTSQLHSIGVELVLGARVENLKSLTEPYTGSVSLSNGRTLEADLIIPVTGARARSELLASLPGAVVGSANRVKADGWMRPSALPNLFAAGDAVDLGDPMTIGALDHQIDCLSKLLCAQMAGCPLESLPQYQPSTSGKRKIVVPLGPHLGASSLGILTVGPFLTRLLKGKDLFLNKYHKLMQAPE